MQLQAQAQPIRCTQAHSWPSRALALEPLSAMVLGRQHGQHAVASRAAVLHAPYIICCRPALLVRPPPQGGKRVP